MRPRDSATLRTPPADAFWGAVVEIPPLNHEETERLLRLGLGDREYRQVDRDRSIAGAHPRSVIRDAQALLERDARAAGPAMGPELLRRANLLGRSEGMVMAELQGPAGRSAPTTPSCSTGSAGREPMPNGCSPTLRTPVCCARSLSAATGPGDRASSTSPIPTPTANPSGNEPATHLRPTGLRRRHDRRAPGSRLRSLRRAGPPARRSSTADHRPRCTRRAVAPCALREVRRARPPTAHGAVWYCIKRSNRWGGTGAAGSRR